MKLSRHNYEALPDCIGYWFGMEVQLFSQTDTSCVYTLCNKEKGYMKILTLRQNVIYIHSPPPLKLSLCIQPTCNTIQDKVEYKVVSLSSLERMERVQLARLGMV